MWKPANQNADQRFASQWNETPVDDFNTPIHIVPEFDLSIVGYETIKKAIITISKGYQFGDVLELDTNYTITHQNNQTKIEHTNIIIANHHFNTDTAQLILLGEDSIENYANIFESLLLESPHELKDGYHEIRFTVFDAANRQHRLGTVCLANRTCSTRSLLDELTETDLILGTLLHESQDGFILDSFYQLDKHAAQLSPDEATYIFGPGLGNDRFISTTEESAPRVIHLTGVDKGPSAKLEGKGSWILKLADNNDYRLQDSALIFDNGTNGTITLHDGSDLYFENVDCIVWSKK